MTKVATSMPPVCGWVHPWRSSRAIREGDAERKGESDAETREETVALEKKRGVGRKD